LVAKGDYKCHLWLPLISHAMFIVAKASLIETVEFEARNSKHLAVLHHVDIFQKKHGVYTKKTPQFFQKNCLGTDKKTIAFFPKKRPHKR